MTSENHRIERQCGNWESRGTLPAHPDDPLAPQALLQATIDTVDGRLIVIDRGFRIVLANRAAIRIAGADAIAQGLTCYCAMHGRDLPCSEEVACPVEQAIQTKRPVTATQLHPSSRGHEIATKITATPILDASGEVASVVVWSRDVSESDRVNDETASLRAQLREARKMEALGQLASGIVHDFNNILTGILGNVELMAAELESELPPDDTLVVGLAQIDRAGRRAAALTQQLLTLRRRQSAAAQVLDPNQIIRDIEEMLRGLLETRITLDLSLAPAPYHVHAEAVQLEQIVMSLVFNARDAMPNGGRLRVATANAELDQAWVDAHPGATVGPHVVIAVSDTGCGMDAETRDRTLEPFFAAEVPEQRFGLGLSAVYSIVRQRRGYITIDSEVDRGSTFKVYLPAV